MAASLEMQRESVRKQTNSAVPVEESFFTTAWPRSGAPVAAVMPVATAASADCERIPEGQLSAYIEETARKEGFTPDLLRAVIAQESSYLPCAVSPKGAQGLMQLMPATASDLGVQNPFDPEENISAGARFLGRLLTRYGGDLSLALAAYNAGPGRVDSYRGLPPIPETLNYVSSIMQRLQAQPVEMAPLF